jgi:ADP-ribose pyrophosphatase
MTEPVLLQAARFTVNAMTMTDKHGNQVMREVIRHPGAVVLIPILNDGRIVMIENYRRTVAETLLELPAGTIEIGEPPELTAPRELIEETGYRAGKITKVLEFYSCPGICDELMHLYAATDLVEGDPEREATEEIENRIVSPDEIRSLIQTGKIRDAKTLVGLYWYLNQSAA